MLRSLLLGLLALSSWSSVGAAPFSYENPNGVGIGLGSVSGLTLYHRPADLSFYQGLLAFSSGDFYLSGDYCMAYPGVVKDLPALVPYYCVGAALLSYEHAWSRQVPKAQRDDHDRTLLLGARLPLGVQYFIPHTPLQLTAEVGPSLWVVPSVDAFLQFMVGLRFLF